VLKRTITLEEKRGRGIMFPDMTTRKFQKKYLTLISFSLIKFPFRKMDRIRNDIKCR